MPQRRCVLEEFPSPLRERCSAGYAAEDGRRMYQALCHKLLFCGWTYRTRIIRSILIARRWFLNRICPIHLASMRLSAMVFWS